MGLHSEEEEKGEEGRHEKENPLRPGNMKRIAIDHCAAWKRGKGEAEVDGETM